MNLLVKWYRRGYVSVLVIGLALAYLLGMSWMRWGDLVIDLGRELYVPARLAAGDLLYRDIFYLYGPFSPYFNALLYKMFGVNILSLVLGGVLVTCLICLLLYKLARAFMNIFLATFTVIVFLFVLAFGHYVPIGNYNFMLPYSYPATHGVLFALGAFYFLFRYLDRPTVAAACGTGACVFLCAITRAEIGMMLLAVMSAAAVLIRLSGKKPSFVRPALLFPVGAALLVYGAFFGVAGSRIFDSNLADVFKSNVQGGSPFAVLLSGAYAPGLNLGLMMKSLFFHFLLAAGFMVAGYAASLAGRARNLLMRRGAYVLLALAAGEGAWVFLRVFFNFELQYRSLPVLYLIVGVSSLMAYFRAGKHAVDVKLALLSVFSFLLLMRIMLQVHAWHYGFYILVPGLIVYHAFFFYTLPRLMNNRHVTVALRLGFTLVLTFLMADHFGVTQASYQQRVFPVVSPVGRIMALDNDKTRGCDALMRYLLEQTPREATVAVFPEGVMINFLSQRKSPLYYDSFLPQDLTRERVEQGIVDELVRQGPDHVVVLQRPVEEYGRHGFGLDYGLKIARQIQDGYYPVAQYGSLPFTPEHFSAVIFKRKH